MEPSKQVEIFGQKETVGDWIVVSADLKKVISVASTPEEALRRAKIDPRDDRDGDRPIVMQVFDPALVCLY